MPAHMLINSLPFKASRTLSLSNTLFAIWGLVHKITIVDSRATIRFPSSPANALILSPKICLHSRCDSSDETEQKTLLDSNVLVSSNPGNIRDFICGMCTCEYGLTHSPAS